MPAHLTPRARAELPGMVDKARETIVGIAHPKANAGAFLRKLVDTDPDCADISDFVMKMIGVASSPRFDPQDIAYLDIMSDLENAGAFSPEEMTLLERETPRMRGPAGRSPCEDRAHRFAAFCNGRSEEGTLGEGLHIGVRRPFERVYEGFSGLQALANRAGFNHPGDIFAAAYNGSTRRELQPNMPGESVRPGLNKHKSNV